MKRPKTLIFVLLRAIYLIRLISPFDKDYTYSEVLCLNPRTKSQKKLISRERN